MSNAELITEIIDEFKELHEEGEPVTMYAIGKELCSVGLNNTENLIHVRESLKEAGVKILVKC